MQLKTLIYIVSSIYFLAQCAEPAQPLISYSDRAKASVISGESTKQEEVREPIDPGTIRVLNLAIGSTREGGQTQGGYKIGSVASYEVRGQTDYLFWRLCPLEPSENATCPANRTCDAGGECVQNTTTFNRIYIPPIYGGEVLFGVRGCVEPKFSTSSETCGPWKEELYDSGRVSLELQQLLSRQAGIEAAIDELITGRLDGLRAFQKEAQECLRHNEEAYGHLQLKLKVIDVMFQAPGRFVRDSTKALVGSNPISAGAVSLAGEGMDNVKHQIVEMCETVDQSEADAVCNKLGAVAGVAGTFAKGMVYGMDPVETIGTLSDAITTISEPEKSVARRCNAERNLSITENAYSTRFNSFKNEYQELTRRIGEMAGQ